MPDIVQVECSGPECDTSTQMGERWADESGRFFCSAGCRDAHEADRSGADALDQLIERLQRDQDRHPRTQDWWPVDLKTSMRIVYERRQDALEELYALRRERDA